MWAAWALKRGYGHLNKECHKVILVLSCSTSQHITPLATYGKYENPARTGCTAPIHSMGLILLQIHTPAGVSLRDEDMLVKHQHQKTEIDRIGSPLPYVWTTSLKCSGLRWGYKLEDNGFDLAEILPSLGNKLIGLMLPIEKLSKDVPE